MSKQPTQASEGKPETSNSNAHLDEVSGLKERYDSHGLSADNKLEAGEFHVNYELFKLFKMYICSFVC